MMQPARIPLAITPTPLTRLERLAAQLGDPKLWMKRDDLTGLELSGNKVRKLEYIAADALTAGCDTLVTEGTCQSNHCRATAAVCAKLGLHCVLLFRPVSAGGPQGNHLLDVLFGAETRFYSREQFKTGRQAIVDEVLSGLRAAGRRPRWVPMGASEPLGCWGYIRAMAELAQQLPQMGIAEADVVMATSSAGTYAGAVLGGLLHRLDHLRLLAVPVSDDVAYFEQEVARLCRAAIKQFSLPIQFDPKALNFIDGYVGAGYAIPSDKAIAALRLLARTEGIVLDPVYTSKAFCGVLDGVAAGKLGRSRPVVFVHTGGIFSNFAWPEMMALS